MNEIKIKNAREATEIKERNAVSVEVLLSMISGNVDMGWLCYHGYIPMSVISDVIKLGFSVKQGMGQIDEPMTIIEW